MPSTHATTANETADGEPQRSNLRGSPETLRRYEQLTGLPFLLVGGEPAEVLGSSEIPPYVPGELLADLRNTTDFRVWETCPKVLHYAVRLPDEDTGPAFGVGFVFRQPGRRPSELDRLTADLGWDERRLDEWATQHPTCSRGVLEKLLPLVVERDADKESLRVLEHDVDHLGVQMQQTYEEISFLHAVARNLHISRSPVEIAQLCLDRAHLLVRAQGTAIWLESREGESRFLVDGTLHLDPFDVAHLVARHENRDWRTPLVRNHVQNEPDAPIPGLRNYVIVPIAEGTNRYGWIVACNMEGDEEFGTPEASLLGSVATILGTHIRNIHLYNEHEQLLVSFVQSLVSTLDAKDPYTRGHSERVALVARRLGVELGLDEEELETLYLSGVLHDIGKIGVDDRILRKPGKLTNEEFAQIKLHPSIGYNILVGLKNLRGVLPGVRNHHENWDGTGYPDRLAGEDIPLLARILAVADAYDAMGSDRPYRTGMPLDRVEAIFRAGANQQWDGRIIDAYFRVRDDVLRICQQYDSERAPGFPSAPSTDPVAPFASSPVAFRSSTPAAT